MGLLRQYKALLIALALISWASVSVAQTLGSSQAEVVIIDPNRLFAETLFGKRITDELEAEGQTLSDENRRIETELRTEEKALTEARKTMTPENFRDSAEAFDLKVQGIRRERLAKLRAFEEKRANALDGFLGTAQDVLIALMRERGASVLLDLRSVILRDGAVDITDEAVVKINVAIGSGEDTAKPVVKPQE